MSAQVHGLKRFVLGEFTDPTECVEAARKLRVAGITGLDAYSPYPLHGIDEALELARQYSGDESVAFINGILDAVSREPQ